MGDEGFRPRGLERGVVEPEQREVGGLADLDRTDLLGASQRPGPLDRREVEELLGGERRRIPTMVLLDEAGEMDLPKHGEGIVRGDRVRAEPHRGTGGPQLDDGATPPDASFRLELAQ